MLERRGSVNAGKPDKQADAAPAVPSVKQTIKIANLADFINRIEQQIRSINELKDSVNAPLPCTALQTATTINAPGM